MKLLTSILALTAMITTLASAAEPEAREWTAKDGTIIRYRWSAPEKIEPGKTYPLILFLHGAGERGTDNKTHLKHGVTPILENAAKLNQPVFLIAPQCPPDLWWSPVDLEAGRLSAARRSNKLLEAVLALVEKTSKEQPVDPKRFYVTGISMGGFATWDLLGRVPDKIAAAIPICGGGDPGLIRRYDKVPIWAFHGEADPVVKVSATKDMVAALFKAGGNPKVTYYPGVEHESWIPAYNDPELYRWLFEQRAK
ncbi:MAG: phospholipase [Verrucomicrobiaceae bacterium]|nr:MAG: phospholipase [Verrucomicrobiaceae bacterium]